MNKILIKAKIRSDFIFFKETNNKGIKEGRLLRDEFWEWLKEKTKIYDRIILIENDELLTQKI